MATAYKGRTIQPERASRTSEEMMLNAQNIVGLQNDAPIGVFDSGVGGLTVVRAFERFLPSEDIIYFGDTARYPYGPRSAEIVTEFAIQDAQLLMTHGIKLLVIACNTASSVAIPKLQENVDIPLIGVINPGAKAALTNTRNNRIGVIGTNGTINSNSYQKAIYVLNENAFVAAKPCPLFVALAQEGFEGKVVDMVGEFYLTELIQKRIDTLILGCTHYPLIKESISRVIGNEVTLIDSAESTVQQVAKFLEQNNLKNPNSGRGKIIYTVSDAPDTFRRVGKRFLKHPIENVRHIRLG